MTSEERASWELVEGDAIAPSRTVLRRLGGGNLYEVHLVWDELLFSICVAKVLRSGQAEDEGASHRGDGTRGTTGNTGVGLAG